MRILLTGIALLFVACATTNAPIVEPVGPIKASDENCRRLVPPSYNTDTYLAEWAFVSVETGQEEAHVRARQKMLMRLCGENFNSSYEANCRAFFAPHIVPWESKFDPEFGLCAVSIIETKKQTEWETLGENVKVSFEQAVKDLMRDNSNWVVAIDAVADGNSPGGQRADSVARKLETAFTDAGVEVRVLPKDWNGVSALDGIDVVVTGRIATIRGKQNEVELDWSAKEWSSGAIRSTQQHIATHLLPPGPDERPLQFSEVLADTETGERILSVRLDRRPGGSMCVGDTTKLAVGSNQTRFARVYNLWGKNKGVLVYAGQLGTGENILVEGLAAAFGDGGVESYLVVAADAEGDLEDLANHLTADTDDNGCRLTESRVQALLTQPLPKRTFVVEQSFRVIAGGGSCPQNEDLTRVEENPQWLQRLPWCFEPTSE